MIMLPVWMMPWKMRIGKKSIRSLIDYSEKLALQGESAIETLEQVLLIKTVKGKAGLYMVDAKEMKKILRANGYDFIRCKGSHFMYSNGKNTIAVNKDLNCMVARRLIKQYDLEYEKQEGSNYGLDGF